MSNAIALPKWLEQRPLWIKTVGEAVRAGWLGLHYAALHGAGAAVRRNRGPDAGGVVVRWNNYHNQTRWIAQRSGVNLTMSAAVVTMQAYGERVARELVFAMPYANRRRRLTPPTFTDLYAEIVTPAHPSLKLDLASPYSLLDSAYRSCNRNEGATELASHERFALLAMGIAVRGIALMERCELCYRWAIPGYRYCHQHSQSNSAPGSPSERSARYRRGKRVAVEFKYPPRAPPACALRPAHRLPRLVARLLWTTTLPDEERSADAVRRALLRYPAVLEVVGPEAVKMRTNRLLERLAERLDPYEINPAAWVWIIERAARWNRIEARLYAAPRQMQFHTRLRIIDATTMAEDGMTRAEIAEQLGIRRSTISNWLQRGVAPKLAAALAGKPPRKPPSRRGALLAWRFK